MSFAAQAQSKRTSPPGEVGLASAPLPFSQTINDAHPLEDRVANWRANEEAFKLQLLQRTQGAAEPIKRMMETSIVEQSTFVPAVAGGPSNLHLDILRNTDASIDWEDVHRDQDPSVDFHRELQKRMGM